MIIKKSDVTLVEEYNGTVDALFMDPWYTNLLNKYITLLEGDEWNVYEISETLYIENILSENKESEEAQCIKIMKEPIYNIQEAIKRVCEAVPLYQSFKKDNITAKDIREYDQKKRKHMLCLHHDEYHR